MNKPAFSSALLKISLTLVIFLTATSVVFARENYFAPLIADITQNYPGPERFSVSEDGQLNGFSYAGRLLPGFPINIDNAVVVSSPVAANLRGDVWPELIFVTRNSANEYFLNAYNSTGQFIASANIGGEVAYDPAVFRANNTDEVFVATSSGNVFSFHLENDSFVSQSIVQLGNPAGLLITTNRELVINFPSLNKTDIYIENNDAWTFNRTINLQSPVIYPFSYDNAATLYGVTRNNQLLAINTAAWQIKAGFPVNLNGVSVGPALVAEINSTNPEYEIAISLSNAETLVFRTNGSLLEKTGAKQFAETGLAAADTLAEAEYSTGLRSLTGRIANNSLRRIISYLSRIKAPSGNMAADINVRANNIPIASGGNFDLGSVILNSNKDFSFVVENLGSDVLVLNGNQLVGIDGPDAADFQITQQPAQVLMPGLSSQIGMRFSANSVGVKNASIKISSNDSDEAIYTVNILTSVTSNLVTDGDMEAQNLGNWKRWSVPVTLQKSNVEFHQGLQSMNLNSTNTSAGVQQLNIPVQANHHYKLSFYYKIVSAGGTLESLLGIRTSNGDFEQKKLAINKFDNNWHKFERNFTVPLTFVSDFRLNIIGRNSDVFVDDVKIEESAFAPSAVADGDMESDGMVYWRAYGIPVELKKDRSDFSNGIQSIFVNSEGTNSGVQQLNINVRPGKYRLTFDYKFASGILRPMLGIKTSNADFEGKYTNLTASANWQSYSREFVVPDTFINDFRIVLYVRNGRGNMDNVRIDPI